MNARFKGARALITGGGSGIGRAVASQLRAEGARIFLAGRSEAKLRTTFAELVGTDQADCVLAGDLAEQETVERLADRIGQLFGGLDILIHSAGLFGRGAVADTPVRELDRLYRAHLRAPYLLTRALLPLLRQSQGQVVFLNSSAALAPRAELGPYCASKLGLRALADSLREEENGHGIRVLSVFPGRTATPMQRKVYELEGRDYVPESLMQPEEVAASILGALALPRTAEITEIALRPMRKG